jgi:excisionase family DNA binding protein
MMKPLLTIGEASGLLRLKVATLYKYSSERRIPVVKCGSRVMFAPDALEKWVNRNTRQEVRSRCFEAAAR